MGRAHESRDVIFNLVNISEKGGERTEVRKQTTRKVDFFTWEKLDLADELRKIFKFA